MKDSAQLLVTVLGAGGGGAALIALIQGFYKWLNGSAGRERDKNTDIATQRNNAVQEKDQSDKDRDKADSRRRNAYEYASQLRRQLIEAGIEPIPMPSDEQNSNSVVPDDSSDSPRPPRTSYS